MGKDFIHCRVSYQFITQQEHWVQPFYLNNGHEPTLPIQILKCNEEIRTESVGSFVRSYFRLGNSEGEFTEGNKSTAEVLR